MIRSILYTQSRQIQNIPSDQIEAVLSREDGFLWVDMVSESAETSKLLFQNVFKFHPVSIDDALLETHLPKVIGWDTYMYLVFCTVKTDHHEISEIRTPELGIFLGSNYLVTYHEDQLAEIEEIWERCHQDQRLLSIGAGYLLYLIADEIVYKTIELSNALEDRIEQFEDDFFHDPQIEILEHIFLIKRAVLKLHRILLPQKDVFSKLMRGDFDLIQENVRINFQDLYNLMMRLQKINEDLHDLVIGALDTIFQSSTNA